uniref:Uncharacterized protein n=1 Tax=viral metagenome TaxID=1070528 RepID=A0A6M3IWQ1_9ZZZZ
MKAYPEQHAKGTIVIENVPDSSVIKGDIGVQVAIDSRIWVCINGLAFLRFSPHKDGKMSK